MSLPDHITDGIDDDRIRRLMENAIRAEETIIDEDDSPFKEESVLADSSDCEPDLFGHKNEEYERDQIEYSQEKLEVFPESTSILGSLLKQSVVSRDYKLAGDHFKHLISMPIEQHGFNTLVVELMYMLYDPYNNRELIRKYIAWLKEKYPMREEGQYYEGVLEYRLGNVDKALFILRSTVDKCKKAPRSSEFLTYELLKLGNYEEVVRYAEIAVAMSASIEPVIDIDNVCYCKCLADEALLHRRLEKGEVKDVTEIDDMRLAFEELKIRFDSLRFSRTIEKRIAVLNLLRQRFELSMDDCKKEV